MMVRFFASLAFCTLATLVTGCSSSSAFPRGAQTVDYYGNAYQECISKARDYAMYIHPSMQENAMGKALGNCMYDKGWTQFAPPGTEEAF